MKKSSGPSTTPDSPFDSLSHSELDPAVLNRLKIVSMGTSGLTLAVGCLVLVGWILDVQALKSLDPSWVSMKANTAIAFMLAGAALLFYLSPSSQIYTAAGRLLSILVLAVGLLTLVEDLVDVNLGIDQLIFRESPGAVGTRSPGRMSMISAFCFVLLGTGMLSLGFKARKRFHLAEIAGTIIFFISLGLTLGFVYEARHMILTGTAAEISIQTVFLFLTLSVGLILGEADHHLVVTLSGAGPIALLARWTLPSAFLIPSVICTLLLIFRNLGLLDPNHFLPLLIMLVIAAFNALMFLAIRSATALESEVKQSLLALAEAGSRFELLLEYSPDGILIVDGEGTIRYANALSESLFQYSRDELIGKPVETLVPARFREKHLNHRANYMSHPRPRPMGFGGDLWAVRKDGSEFAAEIGLGPIQVNQEMLVSCSIRDITDRKSLLEQFYQSQKMEAVGRLAGGIAHDFNNHLTVIIGYSESMLSELDPGSPARQDLEAILNAGSRAASLTHQLLAYSRKQILEPKTLNLSLLVRNIEGMLLRLIGEDIEVVTQLEPNLWSVKADENQIEQVVLNLAVNARDAMPEGGKLTVETRNVELDEDYERTQSGVKAGPHVMLAVSDNGIGMDADTQRRIFEPFFTTKEKGRGTGLGLATTYGVVKQCGGHISLYSEPGRGSTFKIYFPRIEATIVEAVVLPEIQSLYGKETILVVEDAGALRGIVRKTLENYGYTVLLAKDGYEAIEMSGAFEGPIDLLLTDVVLPGMNGRELSSHLSAVRPALKVIFMSGYTNDVIARHGALEPGINLLEKPFRPADLARKVREVLHSEAGPW